MLLSNQYQNGIHKEFINLFHEFCLPLHFNHKGNKQFTNYQRVALIILHVRSRKSIRDFLDEFHESKWISWLGFKKVPKKSTLHDWIKLFNMKLVKELNKLLIKRDVPLAVVDEIGIDSWQRSRHYQKRIGDVLMPYLKLDLFVNVKGRKIFDFTVNSHRKADVRCAEQMLKRNRLKNMTILGDGAYDCE